MTNTNHNEICSERAAAIFDEQTTRLRCGTDRIFAGLMVFQWLCGIIMAITISPYTWIGATSYVHLHVWCAFLFGSVLSGFPIYLAIRHPGTVLTRHTITIAQMLWSALLIHLTGGRIETHFHVFGSLAFVAFYRDWKVLSTATLVVTVDHFLRGILWPQSVFGVLVESPFRWIEHAAWVAFEDVILFCFCARGIREMHENSQRQALLEATNERIEKIVDARTAELRNSNQQLAGEIAERQSAEARETRVGRIIERSLNEIYVFRTTTLQFLEVNQSALDNLGYSIEKMRSLTPLDLMQEYTREKFAQLTEPLLSGARDVVPLETVYIRRDQSTYPVEVHLQLADWSSETVFVAISLDVTARDLLQAERDSFQEQLVDTSRQAGMAEIATGVLHNVGNVLNSVNVSANLIQRHIDSRNIRKLSRVAGLIREQGDALGSFMTEDPRGQRLPGYISKLTDTLIAEQHEVQQEFAAVQQNIEHIKEIVQVQQAYACCSGSEELVQLADLIRMSLKINDAAIHRHAINIECDFEDLAPVVTDKHKVLQILINLITNAKNAIEEHDGEIRRITICIRRDGDDQVVEVTDTGHGIQPEHLTRIFGHGFTTRSKGHGFGLHTSANAAVEVGGSLSVASEGSGHGAVFTLRLPMQPQSSPEMVLTEQTT